MEICGNIFCGRYYFCHVLVPINEMRYQRRISAKQVKIAERSKFEIQNLQNTSEPNQFEIRVPLNNERIEMPSTISNMGLYLHFK